jgi:hypothetical protein
MKILAVVLLSIILAGCVPPDTPIKEKVKRRAVYISEMYNKHVAATLLGYHNEAFKMSYEMWLGGATDAQSETAYTKLNQMCLLSKKMFI